MQAAVFTGGPNIDTERVAAIASSCDIIYAADSGAEIALSCGIVPTKVIGDMDSIRPDTRAFIEGHNIPCEVFPVEKDMTDSELCVSELPEDCEIILIGSFSGRPDHALANMMMAIKLRSEGRDITLTDGVNDFIPLCGPDELSIEGVQEPESLVVSLIPFTDASGVTTEGLYYKLNDADLTSGSSFSVSNKIEDGKDAFSIKIKEGKVGVMIAPNYSLH